MRTYDSHQPYFRGVAMALILFGAVLFAVGLSQWVLNLWWVSTYFMPSVKVMAGAVIMALGYIHLELELIRIRK